MADRVELEEFLGGVFGLDRIATTPRATLRLRNFDFDRLYALPGEEVEMVREAIREGVPQPERDADAVVLPVPASIDELALEIAIGNLARQIRARGIDSFSPEAQALFLECDCWPFPITGRGDEGAGL